MPLWRGKPRPVADLSQLTIPRRANAAVQGSVTYLLSEDGTQSIRRATFKALPCPISGTEVSSAHKAVNGEG